MEETIIRCDSCRKKIPLEDLLELRLDYDLCERCVRSLVDHTLQTTLLCMDCTKCKGKGKISVRDDDASDAQASCGENRTVYKTIECDNCFHG